jgi:hypothetical protein
MEYLTQRSPSSDFGENQLSRGLISLSLLLSSHLRIFQHPRVRSSTACYRSFNLLKSRSPPLRVYCPRLIFAHFALGFPSPPVQKTLSLPRTITRRLIMQKASSHPLRGSYTLYAIGFRFYFTPLAGVLFTFPSRYLFTIGCQGVFSLIRWSGQIHAEFHVHRVTWDALRGCSSFRAPGSHGLWPTFPNRYANSTHLPYQGPATPGRQVLPVWALPLSLATTDGITLVFFSWGY